MLIFGKIVRRRARNLEDSLRVKTFLLKETLAGCKRGGKIIYLFYDFFYAKNRLGFMPQTLITAAVAAATRRVFPPAKYICGIFSV